MAVRKEEVRVTADVNNFVTKFAAAGRAADGFANRLEAADGRLAGLVQSGLALAPALAPIGAAAVPAIAGLTTQLGLAAVAAGATVLAFQGVGDAVKALDTFKTTPTAQNFAKLQQSMDKLGPAGQEFVLTLQRMKPEIQMLQSLTQGGLFPGLTSGFNDMLAIAPRVEDVLFTVSKTLGNLSAEAGQNIASPEFVKFFTYLDTTAGPVLTEMGRTLGNFLEGTGNLILAFDPLARDFSTGLLEVSRSFVEFTANLDSTQGFQDFVSYVEKSGPAALDALGSIGNALVQLVEAAAPVGTAVLPIISALADGLAAIADSPVGPALISAAAAVGVLGRSLALLKIVGLRGGGEGIVAQTLGADKLKGTIASIREASAATKELAAAQQTSGVERGLFLANSAGPLSGKFLQSTDDYSAALVRQSSAEERAKNATAKRNDALRASATQVGKATAAVGGLALATSGLADNTGLANTASLGLMGTIAGPYGAAVGVGIGAVMDLAGANDTLVDAIAAADRAMSSANANDQLQPLDALREKTDAYREAVHNAWRSGGGTGSVTGDFKIGMTAISDLFTNTAQESQEATQKLVRDQMAIRQGIADLYANLNGGDLSLVNAPLAQVTAYADKVAPALSAAGLSFDDLATKPHEAADAVSAYSRSQQDAVTDSQAVSDAMNYLSGQVVPALTTATDLNSDGVINNTDAVLANVDAMKKQTDAKIAAFDAETAYQAALDEGKNRDKEKADIQQQIADAQAAGAQRRADIRQQAGQGSSDAARNIGDLRGQLSGAKTASQRQSLERRIADAQRNQSRAAAKAQEDIAQSFKDQAKTVADLRDRLADYRNTLDVTTEAGRKNRDILSDQAKAYNNLSDKQKNAKGAYESARNDLIDQARKFGATSAEAKKLADRLLEIPPSVQAKITLDAQKAEADLKAFSDAFRGLDGKVAKAFIKLQQDHIVGPTGKLDRASGGKPSATFADGGYTGDGARLEPAGIVHRGEFVVDAIRTREHRSLLNAIQYGSRMPGYANGGYVTGGGLSSSDMASLVKALGSMRPVVGTQIVQPHNYNEFRRQQDANARAAAVGGVSFGG